MVSARRGGLGFGVPSVPAFWVASGGPASHEQPTRKAVPEGTARMTSCRTDHPSQCRVEVQAILGGAWGHCDKWSARMGPQGVGARCDNEREKTQSRKTHGAHCQTPHVPVSGWPRFFHHDAFGWRRRQVMARTSSKRLREDSTCEESRAPVTTRSRKWVSTSLAEP